MSASVPVIQLSKGTKEVKKPIPTPRRTQLNPETQSSTTKPPVEPVPENKATTSKQIVGDFKNVLEGTRQSVRRITRRFSSASLKRAKEDKSKDVELEVSEPVDIFDSIKFASPIRQTENIYNNVSAETESDESDASRDLPPPSYPPPTLPESLYDAPLSSSGTSTSGKTEQRKVESYEAIFPRKIVADDDEDAGAPKRSSWKFYDPVTVSESGNVNRVLEKNVNATEDADGKSEKSAEGSMKTNSVYENHEILSDKPFPRPSKSIIMQFDPLSNSDTSETPSVSYDMKLLEELLQGDLYGNISNSYSCDDWSVSNESDGDEAINPPTPPMRVDSLPEEDDRSNQPQQTQQPHQAQAKTKTKWFTSDQSKTVPVVPANATEPKKNWLKQVKDAFDKARSKEGNAVERPAINLRTFVQKKGMLYKVQNGPVEDLFGEYSGRWCVLENSNFSCYSDNSCLHLKEHFSAQNVLSVQILRDKKYNYRYDNDDLHCFELNTTGKSRGGHVYGARNISERRIWMQVIAESLTSGFGTRATANYTRMGWCYVREGISGKWIGAWVLLGRRELSYVVRDRRARKLDLRKARCVVLQPFFESEADPSTNDRGPNMLVDLPDLALYLRFWTARETKVWCHIVKLEAHNNGANLDEQQLTKNDVPVIVEKCVNFVYAHGSMTEGVYRKAGTSSSISEIMAKFRKDAFSVQLTNDVVTDHEVATALKRFFRDLPEPLLGSAQRQYLHEVSKHNDRNERIRMYKAALDLLPPVSFKTTRKLLGHLHFIGTQSARNLMTVENLASIWGPTLLEDKDDMSKSSLSNVGQNHQLDTEVVGQLIALYRHIFPEDPGELEKEKRMLGILEKYANSPFGGVNQKTAGEFRVWIYLFNKDGKSFNIAVGPNKTAHEICRELSCEARMPVYELGLEEVVLNEKLTRYIHHNEKVLEVVLKWGYWDEPDRKDNYLRLSPLSKYWEFLQEKPPKVSGELKFADSKTRLFKQLSFQFSNENLVCFKEKSAETVLHSWNVNKITWYFGHEPKRNPATKWTITFIETDVHPKRTKSSPFWGSVIVWNDAIGRVNWLSAILKARYGNYLTPPLI